MSSPGHESANLGPSALHNEESNNRVCYCTPNFANEEHHGGLEGVDLQSRTETDLNLKTLAGPNYFFIYTRSYTLSPTFPSLPGRHQAGRFAGRRLWHWQPPPWVRHQWQNTTYCITTASGSRRSVKKKVTRERNICE